MPLLQVPAGSSAGTTADITSGSYNNGTNNPNGAAWSIFTAHGMYADSITPLGFTVSFDGTTFTVGAPIGELGSAFENTFLFGYMGSDYQIPGFEVIADTCTYSILPASVSLPRTAGSGSVAVTTQDGCAWIATANDSFLHTTASGTGPGDAAYTVDANPGAARVGTITIAGQTFTVNQAGQDTCTFALAPTGAIIPQTGGSFSFLMISDAGCNWTATPVETFLHTTQVGTGNGTINYTADANAGDTSRVGTITVGGQVFTVTQAGVPPVGPPTCAYSIAPTSASYDEFPHTGSFLVTSNFSTCLWDAVADDDWIEVLSDPGVGTDAVAFAIERNLGAARTGTITTRGHVFTIHQVGHSPCYTLGPGCSATITRGSAPTGTFTRGPSPCDDC